jgi:hypothetical protein
MSAWVKSRHDAPNSRCPLKSRIAYPRIAGSLLDRFYRYTWPRSAGGFSIGASDPRQLVQRSSRAWRGRFSCSLWSRCPGCMGRRVEPVAKLPRRSPPQLPAGGFSLIPYKFARTNSSMISRARAHARARKAVSVRSPVMVTRTRS